MNGSTVFCCGVGSVVVAVATTSPSFPPLSSCPGFPSVSRRPSVVVIGVGTVPSMASRSNVFGVSMGVGCGVGIASGANPPALVCHSISSIIFISSCRLEDDFGRFSPMISDDGCEVFQRIVDDEGSSSIVVDGSGIISVLGSRSACPIGRFQGASSGVTSADISLVSGVSSTTGSIVFCSIVSLVFLLPLTESVSFFKKTGTDIFLSIL